MTNGRYLLLASFLTRYQPPPLIHKFCSKTSVIDLSQWTSCPWLLPALKRCRPWTRILTESTMFLSSSDLVLGFWDPQGPARPRPCRECPSQLKGNGFLYLLDEFSWPDVLVPDWEVMGCDVAVWVSLGVVGGVAGALDWARESIWCASAVGINGIAVVLLVTCNEVVDSGSQYTLQKVKRAW